MKSKMKRLLAVLLSVMLVFSVVPMAAWAEEPVDTQADADTAQKYWITSDIGIVRPNADSKDSAYAGAGETTVYFQPYSHYELPENFAITATNGTVTKCVSNGNGYDVTLLNVTADTKLTIEGYTLLPTYQVSLPKEYTGYNIAVDVGTYQPADASNSYIVKVGQTFDFEVYFTDGSGEGQAFDVKADDTTLIPDTGYSGYIYHASGVEGQNIQIKVDVVAAKSYTDIYASKFVVPADANWNGTITDAYDEAYQYINRVEVSSSFTFYIKFLADQGDGPLTVSYGSTALTVDRTDGKKHYYTIPAVVADEDLTVTGLSPHTHNWGDWTPMEGSDMHRHTCTMEGCGYMATAPHSWDEGKVTTEPTCTETGVKTYTCDDCNATKTEDINKIAHAYTDKYQKYDSSSHKAYCACGDVITEVHDLVNGVCTKCGYTKPSSSDGGGFIPHSHAYGEWSKVDDTNHQRVCSCGDVVTEAHKWDEGKVTTEPTCTETGVKTYTCTGCGATRTEKVPATGKHTYNLWAFDASSHRPVCACGKVDRQYTPAPHSFSGDTCTKCGYTKQAKTVTINKSLVTEIEKAAEVGKNLAVDIPAEQESVHVTKPAAIEISKSKVDTVINLNQTDGSNVKVTIPSGTKINSNFDLKVSATTKDKKTCVVSIDTGEQQMGVEVAIPITTKTDVKKGKNVYVYKEDEKTGKLVENANSKQKVAADGSVVIEAQSGTDYVVSAKKLSGKNVETIKDNISVSMSKTSVTAGKKVKVSVSLPDTVSLNDSFGTEKAIITYKSSDSKVASVSANGTIAAKKKGTAVIITTIKLESGQTKTVKRKIIVH